MALKIYIDIDIIYVDTYLHLYITSSPSFVPANHIYIYIYIIYPKYFHYMFIINSDYHAKKCEFLFKICPEYWPTS